MTNSAFAFLNGRSYLETAGTTAGAERRRRSRTLNAARQRLAAKGSSSIEDQRVRRDRTDAYLDRTGMSSVGWLDGLTRLVQR